MTRILVRYVIALMMSMMMMMMMILVRMRWLGM